MSTTHIVTSVDNDSKDNGQLFDENKIRSFIFYDSTNVYFPSNDRILMSATVDQCIYSRMNELFATCANKKPIDFSQYHLEIKINNNIYPTILSYQNPICGIIPKRHDNNDNYMRIFLVVGETPGFNPDTYKDDDDDDDESDDDDSKEEQNKKRKTEQT